MEISIQEQEQKVAAENAWILKEKQAFQTESMLFHQDKGALSLRLQTERAQLTLERNQFDQERGETKRRLQDQENKLAVEQAMLAARQKALEQSESDWKARKLQQEQSIQSEYLLLERERSAFLEKLAQYQNEQSLFSSERLKIQSLKLELDAKKDLIEKETKFIQQLD